MVKIICPNCAADLEIPQNAPIHTCEFCGTAIQVSNMVGPNGSTITGEEMTEEAKNMAIIKEHFIIRCHYNAAEAQTIMEDWIAKIPGSPDDFKTNRFISKCELKFYPIWVGEYKAESTYVGLDDWPQFGRPAHDRPGWYEFVSYYKRQENGNVLREYQFPLLALSDKSIPKYLQNYTVTTTGKEYFDISHVKTLGGQVIDSVYTIDQVKNTMHQFALDRQSGEMRKEVVQITNRTDNVEHKATFYIHFPVWEIKFTYEKKEFDAYIDGSNGRIIQIKVPTSAKFHAVTLGAGAAHAVGGAGLLLAGLGIPAIGFFGITVGLGLLVTGIIFISMNFRKTAQESQK
jgi:hypothetical protein